MYTEKQRATIDRALAIIAGEFQRRGGVYSDPGAVKDFCRLRLAGLAREEFLVLFLDSQHQLIEAESLFQGTLDGAAVYPREVAKRALELNAAALIASHNHPSGIAQPSAADRRITERLQAALALLDIRFLDHVVVTDVDAFSFAEDGLL